MRTILSVIGVIVLIALIVGGCQAIFGKQAAPSTAIPTSTPTSTLASVATSVSEQTAIPSPTNSGNTTLPGLNTPTPTPTNTNVPAEVLPSSTPLPTKSPVTVVVVPPCPNDGTMMQETSLARSINTNAPGDGETCKWNFQLAVPTSITLPVDALLTAKMANGSHVLWIGPAVIENVFEGTLRLTRGYASDSYVHTTCGFVQHEIDYSKALYTSTSGADNIQYQLGNITTCNVDLPVYSAWTCPITATNVSATLGGTGAWLQSPDDPTLWVYTGIGGWKNSLKLNYPDYGWYEFWSSAGKQLHEQIPDDNATFHCVEK